MNNYFGYCDRCYKKIIDMEDIYVRQTDDGDALYCSKCKAEILHTEQEFLRLVKVYNIDLAKVSRDTDKECKAKIKQNK